MAAKIFKNAMTVGLAVFLLSVALFMGMLYQYFGDQLTRELATEAAMVAQGVETTGRDYLDTLNVSSRVTWVDKDGTVLYDNRADPAQMENHADRAEIRQAMLASQGTAQRESSTLSRRTYYAARRLSDGTVIRLASDQSTVIVLLASMIQPLLIILVLAMILAAVLASRLARGIIRPILDLNLEAPEECQGYDELAPLITKIRRQNDTIRRQIDAMRQQQREFATLTENMSEGVVLLNTKGRILSYNSGALRLLGAASPAEQASVLTLDRSDAFRTVVERSLDGQRAQGRLERGERCVQLLADPVFHETQVEGAVLVLVDVTAQEQGERLRREFTANVSHELKTPLTAISGMAEIIKDGIVKPSSPDKSPAQSAQNMQQSVEEAGIYCESGWSELSSQGYPGVTDVEICLKPRIAYVTFDNEFAADMYRAPLRYKIAEMFDEQANSTISKGDWRLLSGKKWSVFSYRTFIDKLQKQWGGTVEKIG